ncbi:MAG: GAF domain-containing protein [Anaerolineae bacterium]
MNEHEPSSINNAENARAADSTTEQQTQKNEVKIDERKQAEEASAQRAQELEALYHTSLEINALQDLPTLLQSIITRASDLVGEQMGALYLLQPDGQTLRLTVGYNLREAFVGTTLQVGEGLAGKIIQTGAPLMVPDYQAWPERAVIYATSSWRRMLGMPLKASGQVIGVITITDTQRTGLYTEAQVRVLSLFADQAAIAIDKARLIESEQRQQESLAREKEQLALTLDSIGDGMITTDCDEQILLLNPRAEQLTGWDRAAAIGQPLRTVLRLINMRTGEPAPDWITEVLQKGVIRGLAEDTALVARDGTRRIISSSVAPVHNAQGQITGLVLVFRDITLIKQAEQQTIRAERLAALGRMSAALAHEINNPLQAISSTLDLALDFDISPEEREQNLRTVRQEIDRLADITRRILNLSRPTTAPRHFVQVVDLVQHTLTLAHAQLQQAAIQLTTDFEPSPNLLASPEQLIQVLLHLILNSVQAAGEQGRLHVSIHPDTQWVTLAVTHNGPILSRQEMVNIFEPFYTTETEANSVGLYTSQMIVQQHGGAITVENVGETRGVRFSVRLPV